MRQSSLRTTVVVTIILVAFCSSTSVAQTVRQHKRSPCEPILPILEQSRPSDPTDPGIRSCDLLRSPSNWASYCIANNLVCEPLDEDFFEDWTIVAVSIDTISPVLCENAGPVPAWEVACISNPAAVRVRVARTIAGATCECTLNPQYPTRVFLIHAIAQTDSESCLPFEELHTIECLFGR